MLEVATEASGDWMTSEVIVNALIAAGGGPDHIVRIRNRVWTIQHPIDERFGNQALFDCRYNDLVQIAWSQGAFNDGTSHRVWIDRGALMWEEIP
jgi:hypothetical protein